MSSERKEFERWLVQHYMRETYISAIRSTGLSPVGATIRSALDICYRDRRNDPPGPFVIAAISDLASRQHAMLLEHAMNDVPRYFVLPR